MAKTRRRGYPNPPTKEQEDNKYGRRGNARGKDTKKSTGGGPQYDKKK